ncbi:zinc-binding dehydrogenase [Streptomyces phaeoluteigriseus]|uniref:Zinc-binding dehydrogenase n=1 Tax=Streptomyces phaeoluteigriseus TaxID=114686 RepID=A0ABY4ZAX4_9ACTN|nr:zinc-binding dehydrogenase [Streptomyces phaeoluteigriseus]
MPATASPADQSAVRDFGAAVVIDHRAVDPAAEALRFHPAGVDALVDLVQSGGRPAASAKAVRPGGRVLAIASDPNDTAGRDDVSMRFVMTAIAPGDLEALADWAVGGVLRPRLTRDPLEEAAQAYTDLQDRHTFGKLVVSP